MANNSKEYIIKENLEKIKEWIANGVTMQAIAKELKVSKQTLYKYLNLDDEDTIRKARAPAVRTLENTMYKSAVGYERKVKKYQKLKRILYNENGKKAEEYEEMAEYEETIYYPPDTTAAIFLLKNWARYMNEPEALDIRRRELELKESQNW